jgi:hypothetical protein
MSSWYSSHSSFSYFFLLPPLHFPFSCILVRLLTLHYYFYLLPPSYVAPSNPFSLPPTLPPSPHPSHPHSFLSKGKAITSLIAGLSVSTMTKRSMPMPMPAVGGMPLSSAVRKSSSTPHASSSPIAFLSAYMRVTRVIRVVWVRVVVVIRVVMMRVVVVI